MRRVMPLLLFAGWIGSTAAWAGNAVITKVEGDVHIIRDGQVLAARANDSFQENDVIKTQANGTVDIAVNNVAGCRVLPESQSQIVSTKPELMQLKIESGELIVNLTKLPQESSFKVETPTAVASVRGTQFSSRVRFRMPGNPLSTFAVRDGALDVQTIADGRTFKLGEGMALDIPAGFSGTINVRHALGTELASLDQSSVIRTCA